MSQLTSMDMLWGSEDFGSLDQLITEEINSYKLDSSLVDALSPDLDEEIIVWEDVTLEDAEASLQNTANLENTILIDTIQRAVKAETALSPSSSADYNDEMDMSTGPKADGLLDLYSLDDDKLGDITLKKLKSICHSTSDYTALKSYRRTCLNRHYARSSRNKQQNKTNSLATMLRESQQEVSGLRQDNDMKDATIRCLQLELEIMRSLNK